VNSKERRENLISEVTILLDPRVQFLTKNKTYKETRNYGPFKGKKIIRNCP
jgi:hypothetical protein